MDEKEKRHQPQNGRNKLEDSIQPTYVVFFYSCHTYTGIHPRVQLLKASEADPNPSAHPLRVEAPAYTDCLSNLLEWPAKFGYMSDHDCAS